MTFEQDILTVLKEATCNGMPVRRIALNVFNRKNSLFNPLNQEKVYKEVAEWLRNESQKRGACIEKTETKGWYRLNMNSTRVQQLLLDFQPHEEDEWML